MKLLSNDAVASCDATVRAVSIKAAFEGKTFIAYSYDAGIYLDKFFRGYVQAWMLVSLMEWNDTIFLDRTRA
jgi:hypothetical protein